VFLRVYVRVCVRICDCVCTWCIHVYVLQRDGEDAQEGAEGLTAQKYHLPKKNTIFRSAKTDTETASRGVEGVVEHTKIVL